MAQPRLLRLDEPSLGLASMMVEFILQKIIELNRCALSVVAVEQNASLELEIAHDAYVLETAALPCLARRVRCCAILQQSKRILVVEKRSAECRCRRTC